MALVTQTTKNPAISPNATPVPGPIDPDAFRSSFNTYIASVEDKAQLIEALLEALCSAMGNGALSGGTISAGSGLSVNVATLSAMVGTKVQFDASQVVGGLTANSTNSLFLRQDGTWTVNITGAVPTDISAHGDYLLWGTATTDASSVTGVSNTRASFAGGLFTATTQTYTASNVTTDRSFDADTVAVAELADVVGTLIADLRAKGIVG